MNAESARVRRKQELFGVLWAFIGLFFVLCFLSFSPKDPCLLIREGQTGPASNWMGPAGATLAGWLFALIGLSAWLIPGGIGTMSAWSFQGRLAPDRPGRRRRLWLRTTGITILVFSTAIFLALALGRFTYGGESFRSGGIVGHWLAGLLTDLTGLAGAFTLTLLITIIALMAAFDFSPVRAASMLADLAYWAREAVGDLIVRRTEARRRKKEVAVERVQLEKTRALAPIKIVVDKKPVLPAAPKPKPEKKPKQQKFEFAREGAYEVPPLDLLDDVPSGRKGIDQETLLMNAKILENKLKDYGVQGEVVEVHPGPVVTMYEYRPGSGVKINKIANLADDLAMALSALSIRIIAPIPGKNVVGIEISNRERETVYLREIVETEEFNKMKSLLPMALGKDTVGVPYAFDMRKAPHLLVAGSTGSGKSVGLNAMIMSVLLRSTPDQVKMLMIDPKRLELSIYEGIPHLLHPVIADAKDAALSLKWAVSEMERRYKLLAEQGVRHIDSYNRLVGKDPKELKKESKKAKKKPEPAVSAKEADTVVLARAEGEASGTAEERKEVLPPAEPLPLIMIVIDELADLMMVAPKDVEESICRLAQMARAAGIHLILATQRPSVDVITGLIKANFPSRLAFKVSSKVDSRTILDQNGADRLLGQGDMLFLGPGSSQVMRLHGAFVSDQEIKEVTGFMREQGRPDYNEEILKFRAAAKEDEDGESAPRDDKWDDAVAVAVASGQVSVSMLQRKLKIGYNRAARIIEDMEAQGMVGPSDGVKPRQVLVDAYAGMESSMA